MNATGKQIKEFMTKYWPDEMLLMDNGDVEPYDPDTGKFCLEEETEYNLQDFGDLFWDVSGEDYSSFEEAFKIGYLEESKRAQVVIPIAHYETVQEFVKSLGGHMREW